MRRFGLLGHPVGHSKSPELFHAQALARGVADVRYDLFDLADIDEFPAFIKRHPDVHGLNVTVPHKQSILPHLCALSESAKAIGAVNVLERVDAGWKGHNTDAWGFQRSVQPFLTKHHERALVLGTGGSAAAVAWVLSKLGIDVVFVSRRPQSGWLGAGKHPVIAYEDLSPLTLRHHCLVVHCTPLGMAPNVDGLPDLPFDGLGAKHLVVDLVYNPSTTALMAQAQAAGAMTLGGADMLRLQAERSWAIWGAFDAPTQG